MVDPTIISFIARSKRRREVLKLLLEKQISQPEIMRITKMYKAHTSRTIGELCDKKLAICKNPEDRAFKFYSITRLGREILRELPKVCS